MITVKQLLDRKGHEVYSIQPGDTVYSALEKMADKDVGALMVLDGNKLVGIFSERDYARKLILHGKSSKESKVQDFMSTSLYTVNPSDSIYHCMALMTDKRVRHLPVLDQNEIVGMISIGDVVNAIISEQKAIIKDLEDYITGSGYGNKM
ncbi:MAG: CBS domain-containing protein [Bacteroidales bacterium]|nr:CBS domain-containing protein [Bacteroidales bacterium]